MLIVRPIGRGQAAYYRHEADQGVWLGRAGPSLGLSGPADAADLDAVLSGQHPAGHQLLRRVDARHRAGFDLIFAAPKSVSLLAALAEAKAAGRVGAARDQAVGEALGYLERNAAWARRGREHRRIPTTGLVAASFSHQWSAAGDPHLHSHVVVANVVQGDDGMWSCLDSRALYRHAAAAGAVFQASLRHHLAQQGFGFEWQVRPDGLADVVGVPRAAIEACSLRRHQVAAEVEEGLAGRVGRATAASRTRGQPRAGTEGWQERVERAGFAEPDVGRLVATAARQRIGPPAPPHDFDLERRLRERHSRFERRDVVRAAAALAGGGAPAVVVEGWAADFVNRAVAIGDAWTTPALQQLEERVTALAMSPAAPGAGLARLPDTRGLAPEQQNALGRLTSSGAPVEVLRGDFVSQAWVLGAAGAAWEHSGHRVAVVSHTERGAARWQALTGIGPPTTPAGGRPTVVIVDGADRWTTNDLHGVLDDAGARGAKVVLVDGGTAPARRTAQSPAMETLRGLLPVIECAGPSPPAGPEEHPIVWSGHDNTVAVAPSGPAAVDHLVDEWQRARVGEVRPTMIALGPEEAEHLNAAARARLVAAGELRGPAVEAGGRQFQAGDEVRALRRDSRLGAVPGATSGVVASVDPEQQRLTIRWPASEVQITADQLARAPLTYGYATTPPYARGEQPGPLLCLGDPSRAAPRLAADRIVQVAPMAAGTTTAPDPLRSLLAEAHRDTGLAPPGHAASPARTTAPDPTPIAGHRGLGDLHAERDQLADRLRAGAPPDPRPQLRQLAEERDWLGATPGRPGTAARLADLDRRHEALTAAATGRTAWIAAHRGELARWDQLGSAITWREHALAVGAQTRPGQAVLAELGRPPDDPARRPAWRQAAGAIEAYRDRWAIADEPSARKPGDVLDPRQRNEERRVLAACRAFELGHARSLGL